MNLFEDDDVILEQFKNTEEPMIMPDNVSVTKKIWFLRHVRHLWYDKSWYYSDTRRTITMYQREYKEYMKTLSVTAREYFILETKVRMIKEHRRINNMEEIKCVSGGKK